MNEQTVTAWIVLAVTWGGMIGYWFGQQVTVRHCRRIAQSTRLDQVYKEDAEKDASSPEPSRLIHAANDFKTSDR